MPECLAGALPRPSLPRSERLHNRHPNPAGNDLTQGECRTKKGIPGAPAAVLPPNVTPSRMVDSPMKTLLLEIEKPEANLPCK